MHHVSAWVSILVLAGTVDEELAGAARKSAEATSYTFKITTSGGKGKRSGGTVEGKYEKDKPVWMKTGNLEGFRKDGSVAYKEGEEWKRFELLKGAQAKAAGVKRNALPGAALTGVKLPHEELAEIDKAFKEAKKAEAKENDCTVYSGDLTDEAARRFGNPGTKGGGDLAYSGSARVWINAQGQIAKYELTVKGAGKVKEKDVEQTTVRTVEISESGATKVEVPEGALKALGTS